MSLYLKWTNPGRVPSYQGGAPLPEPDVWTERLTDLVLCRRGWHACRWEDAVYHIAAELWVCELGGEIIEGEDKVVAERLRLVRRVDRINDASLRLFGADCAENVLPIFEARYPNDSRPRDAVEAARWFARGKIDRNALYAAWDAARAAAAAADWAAAVTAAWDAAGAAARDAAWAAARAAAAAAAGDAARAAAGAAAWDAAWAAAGDAAGDAAWDAAAAAAWAAARAAQTERLLVTYANLDPANFTHRTVRP